MRAISREDAKDAKFGVKGEYFSLRSWRLSAMRIRNRMRAISREDAKDAKFGEIGRYFSLRAWRLSARSFVEIVLLNIFLVRI
jgi:hypothetical protein